MSTHTLPRKAKRSMTLCVIKKKPTISVMKIDNLYHCDISLFPDGITEYKYGAVRTNKADIREFVLWQTAAQAQKGIVIPAIYV